jgi:hypothetical protein
MSDTAWDVVSKLRGDWCPNACHQRAGCGCADVIDEALAAEREACARIFDEYARRETFTADQIAALIRNRAKAQS